MQLLVAPTADTHPGLEVASWIVAIVAFGLIVLQLFFYWFGRRAPLQVRATGQETRTAEVQHVLLLYVEFRSRTRDTQTVRELVLFKPPNAWSRALRPWWYEEKTDVTPVALPSPSPLPLTIDGHDTAEVRVAFFCDGLPYGPRTRLKVRASRRRPHVARIRMNAEASAPLPALSPAAEVPVAPAMGTPAPYAGKGPDPASRISRWVKRFMPAAAVIALLGSAVVFRRQRSASAGRARARRGRRLSRLTVGRTLATNPGSEYSEGVLRGAIITLNPEKGVRGYQFVAG